MPVIKRIVYKIPLLVVTLCYFCRLMKRSPIVISFLLLAACTGNPASKPADIQHFYAPQAGTLIAADSIRTDDRLNETWFAVRIYATDESHIGKYLLRANYGANQAQSEVVYPPLTETLSPVIRKDGSGPYSFIVGFRFKDKDLFNDYLRVQANRIAGIQTRIQVQYIKAYYVDTTK